MHAVAVGCCFFEREENSGKRGVGTRKLPFGWGEGEAISYFTSPFFSFWLPRKKRRSNALFCFCLLLFGALSGRRRSKRALFCSPHPPKRKAFVGAPRTAAGDLVMGGFKNGGNGAQNAFSFASLLRSNDGGVGVEEKGSGTPTEFITLLHNQIKRLADSLCKTFYALPSTLK